MGTSYETTLTISAGNFFIALLAIRNRLLSKARQQVITLHPF
jgi:hypothetical protein